MFKTVFRYFLCVLYFPVQSVEAQETFPPKNSLVRNRYYEGFRDYKNVSAGKLDLISCIAMPQPVDGSDSLFSIQFYVPPGAHSKPLDIFVDDRTTHTYFMIPAQREWTVGNHTFSWNSRAAKGRGVRLSNLCGIARLKSPDPDQTIIPLSFFGSTLRTPPLQVEYEFTFVATRRATLRYSILDANDTVMDAGKVLDQPKNRPAIFLWTPKGLRVGQYILDVEYQLKNGQVTQGQSIYSFYHGH